MKAELEFITPALAKQLLEQNPRNRNLSGMAVKKYASDMKTGRWNNNGQTIVISESGYLLDGQHRCAAVLASGVTIAAFVVRGAPDKVYTTIDTGRPRSLADLLTIEGYVDAKRLQSVSTITYNYATGAAYGYQPTKAALFEFVTAHPYLTDAVRMAGKSRTFPRAPLGAVVFLSNESRKFDLETQMFVDGAVHGDGLAKGDPRLTVREWYFARANRNGVQIDSGSIFAATARAWSSWAAGEPLHNLRLPDVIRRATVAIAGYDQSLYTALPDLTEEANKARKAAHLKTVSKTRFRRAPAHETQASAA